MWQRALHYGVEQCSARYRLLISRCRGGNAAELSPRALEHAMTLTARLANVIARFISSH